MGQDMPTGQKPVRQTTTNLKNRLLLNSLGQFLSPNQKRARTPTAFPSTFRKIVVWCIDV